MTRADVALAAALAAGVAMVASLLLIAGPLGEHLLPSGGFHFFAGVQTDPKPAEEMRYVLAVAFVLGLALVFALAPLPRSLANRSSWPAILLASIVGQMALVGIVAWSWWAQFHWNSGEPPTVHFNNGDLIAAVLVAGALAMLARRRPHWLDAFVARRGERWVLIGAAVLLTGCWLLPSVFRAQNLAPASREVTYHLQFTFDEFVALLNGRVPLVNFVGQYSSLLQFVLWPVLRVGGAEVGVFTGAMCFLSLLALVAVERAIALIVRNERLAFVLYIPFLATSLFFILRGGPGGQQFSWASYYAVFPIRYVGPFTLFWLCMRHARGMRPRSAIPLFAFAGLVMFNNVEFGAPAFLAAVAATWVASAPVRDRFWRVLRSCVVGVACALAIVAALTLLAAGELPDFGLLTFYSRLFAEGGYGLIHTPVGGLYLIVDLTFAASVLLAALRYRAGASDRTYTAALAFCGVFGLGAGNYYMGRTHPAGLVVLFPIWALAVVLLSVLALRAIAVARGRPRMTSVLLFSAALIALGLISSSIVQFPAPWTQVRRIKTSAPAPVPYDISPVVQFVRRTAVRGESVVVFTPLGHLIALDAGVKNVSPYSHPDGVVTYDQLGEELKALRNAGGTRFYIEHWTYPGAGPEFPEVPSSLTKEGFRPEAEASMVTEWRR